MIQKIVQRAINREELSQEWIRACITSILKKKTGTDERAISVILLMRRLNGNILRERLEQETNGKVGVDQAGF